MPAHVGREPETIETERDQLEQCAAHDQAQEITADAGKCDRSGGFGGQGRRDGLVHDG